MSHVSDEALLAQRDEASVRILLDRHWASACRVARGLVRDADSAEDVAQDAFVRALQASHRFDASRGFRPWFFRIVRNAASNHDRARRRRRYREARVARSELVAGSEPDDTPEVVRRHLSELHTDQREAITLHYLEGLSFEEVASTLDCPLGTVSSRIHRGVKSLKKSLQDVGRLAGIGGIEVGLEALRDLPTPERPPASELHRGVALSASRAVLARTVLWIGVGALTLGIALLALQPMLSTEEPVAGAAETSEDPSHLTSQDDDAHLRDGSLPPGTGQDSDRDERGTWSGRHGSGSTSTDGTIKTKSPAAPSAPPPTTKDMTMSGRVLKDGKPVAGARVILVRSAPGHRWEFDTQEGGTFEGIHPGPGRYTLSVEPPMDWGFEVAVKTIFDPPIEGKTASSDPFPYVGEPRLVIGEQPDEKDPDAELTFQIPADRPLHVTLDLMECIDLTVQEGRTMKLLQKVAKRAGWRMTRERGIELGQVTAQLRGIPWRQAVNILAMIHGFGVEERPGRELRLVFPPFRIVTEDDLPTVLALVSEYFGRNTRVLVDPQPQGLIRLDQLEPLNRAHALQAIASAAKLTLQEQAPQDESDPATYSVQRRGEPTPLMPAKQAPGRTIVVGELKKVVGNELVIRARGREVRVQLPRSESLKTRLKAALQGLKGEPYIAVSCEQAGAWLWMRSVIVQDW